MNKNVFFVRQSLELHLFFARIMKEHSFFLQLGFTPRDIEFTEKANEFRLEFDKLLNDVVVLSDGVVSENALQSGEIVTPFTLEAEKASACLTGVEIATDITKAEECLTSACNDMISRSLVYEVSRINNRAINLTCGLINFKAKILDNVLSCQMFTVNYPLLIEHIMREAKLYVDIIRRLQSRRFTNFHIDSLEQEAFWNRIMAEHSKFIRGLLDPTEEELICTANAFGNEFDELTKEALDTMNMTTPCNQITQDSLQATESLKDFKTSATEGLLDCSIRSIIIPLLGDHTIREANHFIRLLKMFDD